MDDMFGWIVRGWTGLPPDIQGVLASLFVVGVAVLVWIAFGSRPSRKPKQADETQVPIPTPGEQEPMPEQLQAALITAKQTAATAWANWRPATMRRDEDEDYRYW